MKDYLNPTEDTIKILFNTNKYTKWYFNIINNAKINVKSKGFTEHHIIPRSIGGKIKDPINLVYLSYKEHLIVHKLLTKMMFNITHHQKMWFAIHRMSKNKNVRITSHEFERIKLEHAKCMSEYRTGMKFSFKHCQNISKVVKGRKFSNETKAKMSKSKIGNELSLKSKEDISIKMTDIWSKRYSGEIPLNKNMKTPQQKQQILDEKQKIKDQKIEERQQKEKIKQEKKQLLLDQGRIKKSWKKTEEAKKISSEATKKIWELRRAGILPMPIRNSQKIICHP